MSDKPDTVRVRTTVERSVFEAARDKAERTGTDVAAVMRHYLTLYARKP